MPFVISAYYKRGPQSIVEVYLQKRGQRAFYDSFEEACAVAEKMLPLLPRAESIEVYQYGYGQPRRVFRR